MAEEYLHVVFKFKYSIYFASKALSILFLATSHAHVPLVVNTCAIEPATTLLDVACAKIKILLAREGLRTQAVSGPHTSPKSLYWAVPPVNKERQCQ